MYNLLIYLIFIFEYLCKNNVEGRNVIQSKGAIERNGNVKNLCPKDIQEESSILIRQSSISDQYSTLLISEQSDSLLKFP